MADHTPSEQPAVTRNAFRDVIGRFATGVTVVTSHDDRGDHGLTASAVSSLSLDPPMLLVCVNRSSRTGDAIRASGVFTVNVLAEDQVALAHRFATTTDEDKFSGVATSRGPIGTLVLEGSLARIDCRVDTDVVAATHRIFLGAVVGVEGRDVPPLAYFRGQFGQLHLTRDDGLTAALRQRVLTTEHDTPVDVAALAAELGVDASAIDRALTVLRAEGLLAGDPVAGYRVAPLDPKRLAEAIDARTAIELGAAELAMGRASAADIAELRRLAEQSLALLIGGQADDMAFDGAADTAFHETLVRLAGVPALLDAHR
ncbi:MAG TPA: flavin reductase, partial [Euzebya sp.]|nr:flavin reductase [Euzebya sp.]